MPGQIDTDVSGCCMESQWRITIQVVKLRHSFISVCHYESTKNLLKDDSVPVSFDRRKVGKDSGQDPTNA